MAAAHYLAGVHRVASALAACVDEAGVAKVVDNEAAEALGATSARFDRDDDRGHLGAAGAGGAEDGDRSVADAGDGPEHVSAPVMVADGRGGRLVVVVEPDARADRDDADLRLALDLVAQQCGLALDRVRVAAAEERARERLRFLVEASEVLSSSLDYRLTLANVAVLAVPRLADGFSVDIVEDDGSIRRAITTHIDPIKASIRRRLAADHPTMPEAPLGIGPVMASGRSQLIEEVTPEMVAGMANNDEHRRLLADLGLRSQMAVPMRGRDSLVGVLTLVLTEDDRRFTADDLTMAEDLARRAALAVDNARLHDAARAALAAEQDARAGTEQAQRRLTFLLEASTLLSTSLAYPEAHERIARLVVPAMADLCVIDVLAEGGAFVRAAAVHSDPALQPVADELARRYPPDERSRHPAVGVVRTGRSVLLADVDADALATMVRSEENLRLLRRLDVDSMICVALRSQGQVVGAMTLASGPSNRRFDESDLALAEDFAMRAGLALDNARQFSREHHVAATLQRSLLVEQLPEVRGLTLAARYVAGSAGVQVGGDWYDVIPLPDSGVLVMVGDVVGRGLRAASVMGQLRNAARAYALDGHSPGAIASRLSHLLDRLEPGQMATMVIGRLDPAGGRFVYCSAGHPPALVLSADHPARWLEDGRFVPLGVPAPAAYPEAEVTLMPGDTVLLYTDGLVEERGASIDTGLQRLLDLSRPLREAEVTVLADTVVDTIVAATGGGDDVALLAVRFEGMSGSIRTDFAAVTSSLAAVRSTLRPWLERQGATADEVFDLLVASGEACSNALEHAYGPGDNTFSLGAWREGPVVVIEVRDTGRWRAPRGSDRGRGRTIMEALSEARIDTDDEGTVVRLRRTLRSPA